MDMDITVVIILRVAATTIEASKAKPCLVCQAIARFDKVETMANHMGHRAAVEVNTVDLVINTQTTEGGINQVDMNHHIASVK